MGSFCFTCNVSGLPIEHGTPVRYILLTKNNHKKAAEWTCYIGDRWFLRTFPIQAEYNDYGSVENLKPAFMVKAMFDPFKRDAVERGVGDNAAHDRAVYKNQSVEKWLTALWEGRVLVRGNSLDPLPPERLKKLEESIAVEEEKRPAGIPTRSRIEKLLTTAGYKLSTEFGASGYMVNRICAGFMRVRSEGGEYGKNADALEKIQGLIGAEYAVMMTVGSGMYSDPAELLVGPKPKDGQHVPFFDSLRKQKRNLPHPVCQGMIREDVWQALIEMPFDSFWNKDTSINRYYADTEAFYATWMDAIEEKDPRLAFRKMLQLRETPDNVISGHICGHSEGLTGPGFGLREAWEHTLSQKLTAAQRATFLKVVAETVRVQHVLGSLRFQWQQGSSAGPQFGEFKRHSAWLTKLADISTKEAVRRDEE